LTNVTIITLTPSHSLSLREMLRRSPLALCPLGAAHLIRRPSVRASSTLPSVKRKKKQSPIAEPSHPSNEFAALDGKVRNPIGFGRRLALLFFLMHLPGYP
jgi:hypothetical protein